MSEEMTMEVEQRVHPVRYASVFILAAVNLMDTFLLLFTTTLLAQQLEAGILVGLIVPAYTGMNAATELFWGWMSDRYGRRRPLIIGSFFTVPACVMFAFATNPWHLIIANAIRGIGGSADVPIARAIAADLAPRKVLGERMGAFQMARYAAPLIGISISGPLYEIDWRLPFIAAAAFELFDLLLILFVIPETLTKARRLRLAEKARLEAKVSRMEKFRRGAKEWSVILRRRGVALFVLTIFVGAFVGRGISTLVYPLFQLRFGLTPSQISLLYGVSMVIAIMGYTPGGRISDKIGRKFPVIFRGYYNALTNLLYTFIPAMFAAGMSIFPWFFLFGVVGSLGVIIGGPAFLAYFYEWVSLEERGRASAMTDFFDDVGVTFGFPLVAFIYEGIDPVMAFYFATIVGIVMTTIIWIFWKNPPPPEELRK